MTDSSFGTGEGRQGAGGRQEGGTEFAAANYFDRLAVTPPTGYAPVRVMLPLKRYPSPRKAVGWLISVVRRVVLRLAFPALNDLAIQTDAALFQTQERVQQLEELGRGLAEWAGWVERALRVETVARESLAQRVEEQIRHLVEVNGQQAAAATATAESTQELKDRLDSTLTEMSERVDRLDSIVQDGEQRHSERITRVETAAESGRNALKSDLARFAQRLESVDAAASSAAAAAATHLRELLTQVEALAKTDSTLDERANRLDVALTNLEGGLGARIDEIEAGIGSQLDERIDKARADFEDLSAGERERVGRLDAALTGLDTELNTRIDEMQAALLSQLDDGIDRSRIHLEALEASKQKQTEQLERMSEHLAALEEAKQAVADTVPRLEEALSSRNARINDLSERVAEQRTATLELEQAVQAIRTAVTTQLDDMRHSISRASQRLDEIDGLRRDIRNLSIIERADVDALIEPLRAELQRAKAALHEQADLLASQINELSRDSAPRELLDAVAANAARIDRLEEESGAALAAVRRRLQGFPEQPASFHELVDLAERFDRFRAEAFAHVADLAQSFALQAGEQDESQVTHLDAEPRRRR